MLMNSIFVLLCLYAVADGSCPHAEDIAPACVCINLGNGPMMMCNNIMNADELTAPIKATEGQDMLSLAIINSSLQYMPSDVFRNTNYRKIRFANSEIMSLSDTDLAFEGLEDHLEEIRASGAHYITTWDWSQLRNHRRLDIIDVNLISMYSVESELPEWKTLKMLGITTAEISFIHPTAFRKLSNLRYLHLWKNEIEELSRTMLPDPADQLYTIDLSGNRISSLPDDMFTAMPSLQELDLSDNKFITLNEATFKWPLEHLQAFLLKGNDFRCDCRLRWTVAITKPLYFEGNCTLPENLRGIPLDMLNNKVLWC